MLNVGQHHFALPEELLLRNRGFHLLFEDKVCLLVSGGEGVNLGLHGSHFLVVGLVLLLEAGDHARLDSELLEHFRSHNSNTDDMRRPFHYYEQFAEGTPSQVLPARPPTEGRGNRHQPAPVSRPELQGVPALSGRQVLH